MTILDDRLDLEKLEAMAPPCSWKDAASRCHEAATWAMWLDPNWARNQPNTSAAQQAQWERICQANPFLLCAEHKDAFISDPDVVRLILRVEPI